MVENLTQQEPHAAYLIHLFQTLVANKRLPKYQFERRVDAIITIFLPGILKQRFGWNVELVAPEFPLKKLNNQSTNVDHLLFRHADSSGNSAAWIFFELKTDIASCNDVQLDIYRTALDLGMPRLLEDLRLIAAASDARGKVKYAELQSRLARFPIDPPVELVYLAPCRIEASPPCVVSMTFNDPADISLPEFPEVWSLFCTIMLPCLSE